jgi:hypothetical protein
VSASFGQRYLTPLRGRRTGRGRAQLDRQLTNLAIWLPTVTPSETGLTSRRTGNYRCNPVWGALLDQLWIR